MEAICRTCSSSRAGGDSVATNRLVVPEGAPLLHALQEIGFTLVGLLTLIPGEFYLWDWCSGQLTLHFMYLIACCP